MEGEEVAAVKMSCLERDFPREICRTKHGEKLPSPTAGFAAGNSQELKSPEVLFQHFDPISDYAND